MIDERYWVAIPIRDLRRKTSWGKKYIGRSFMLRLTSSLPEYVRRVIEVRRRSNDLLNKLSFYYGEVGEWFKPAHC